MGWSSRATTRRTPTASSRRVLLAHLTGCSPPRVLLPSTACQSHEHTKHRHPCIAYYSFHPRPSHGSCQPSRSKSCFNRFRSSVLNGPVLLFPAPLPVKISSNVTTPQSTPVFSASIMPAACAMNVCRCCLESAPCCPPARSGLLSGPIDGPGNQLIARFGFPALHLAAPKWLQHVTPSITPAITLSCLITFTVHFEISLDLHYSWSLTRPPLASNHHQHPPIPTQTATSSIPSPTHQTIDLAS